MKLVQQYDPNNSVEEAQRKLISHPPNHENYGFHGVENLAQSYEAAIKWLSSFFKVKTNSRLACYQQILQPLLRMQNSLGIVDLLKDEEFKAAFFESHQIIEACLSLRMVSDSVEIPKITLSKLRQGSFLNYRDAIENSENDASRDTFFEIFVAARLLQNGIPVQFTANREDLVAIFEEHMYILNVSAFSL